MHNEKSGSANKIKIELLHRGVHEEHRAVGTWGTIGGGGVSSPWILKDQLTQSQLRGQIMSTTLGAVHKLCRLGRWEWGSPKDDLLHKC